MKSLPAAERLGVAALLAACPEALLILDEHLLVLGASAGYRAATAPEEPLGRPLAELPPFRGSPQRDVAVIALAASLHGVAGRPMVITDGGDVPRRWRMAHDATTGAAGSRTLVVQLAPLDDGEPMGGVVTTATAAETDRAGAGRAHDLDRRIAELERRASELERSNAELERFAIAASHELQEPLRMAAAYLQLLHQRHAARYDDATRRCIGHIAGAAERMQRTIHGVLEIARVGRSLRIEDIDSGDALQQALDNLEAALVAGAVAIEADALPRVRADRVQLTRLFQNLIANAIRFRAAAPPRVAIRARERDGWWEFAVSDNGIGIAAADHARLFRVFGRLHPREAYPGDGIGLAACRRIVEAHGGRIWIESAPGVGTTMLFTLPRVASTQA